MPLNRDDILRVQDLDVQEVDVPEWGGSVCIRQLSGDERELVEIRLMETKDNLQQYRGLRAFTLSMTLCTEEGNQIFTPDDLSEIGQKNAAVLERLFEHVMDASGLGVDAVDELKKNSETAPVENSGSSSL